MADDTPTPSLADDILRGAKNIGDFLGLKGPKGVRKTFYGLERHYIPAVKQGDEWIALRSVLRASLTPPAPAEPAARPAPESAPEPKSPTRKRKPLPKKRRARRTKS